MTALSPPVPRTAVARLAWAVADAWTVARRNLILVSRQPEELFIGLTIPIMMVLVFGYVFGRAVAVPDDGAYAEFVVPGIFVLTMLYGMSGTGTGVATDVDRGVVDRFRSMPIARSAVVAGRSIADMVRAAAEVLLLIGCGLLVGWQWHDGVGPALGAVGLLLLLRLALIWVAIYLGLVLPTPDAVAVAVYPLAFPLTVVSTAFVAPELMPGWLGTVAEWNPLSATVLAIRELFGNPGLGGDSWAAEHALLLAVAWPLLVLLFVVPLAVRRYRRLGR
jgi:ABC transporter DrrB family efflux protein